MLRTAEEETYDFEAPDDKQVKQLTNNNRVITPLAGSPHWQLVSTTVLLQCERVGSITSPGNADRSVEPRQYAG